MTSSNAFVPGFDYDVFISYAHVDDRPSVGAQSGWVTNLARELETVLAQKLGREEDFRLWMDDELSRHAPITPEILKALERTATLLVILSPAYLASDWCRRERSRFLERVRSRSDSGTPVFIVERDRVEEGERPPELEEFIGYKFWEEETKGRAPRILGLPRPNPDQPEYYNRVIDLGHDLVAGLKELKRAAQGPREDAGDGEPRQAVFLADVTDDLESIRDATRRYLDQAGIQVIPETLYPRDPVAFLSAMDRDLSRSKLFVQLLSGLTGKRPPELPQGYVRLQRDRARELRTPILQWRSRELDLAGVEDPDQLALLQDETVLAVGIEEFKREVAERALRKDSLRTQQKRDTALVFVESEADDRPLAESVCHVLGERGLGYALPLRKGDAAAIRKDLEENLLDCDALIIIYGSISVGWVREQLRFLRKILLRREQPLGALAVYQGPPEPKDPLDFNLPALRTLDGRRGINAHEIHEFIDRLRPGVGR